MGNPIGYNAQSNSLLMQAPGKLAGTSVTGPTMTYVANALGHT
jgi:hypothetical protein